MFMPTVKKNRPSRRPLKGSMAVSIALRNSVSASSRPATKAPSAIEKPATAAATPAATITNSVVATNRSLMPADATRRKSGRMTTRPTMTITPSTRAAFVSARMSVAATDPASPVPKMEMKSRSGATARSCASKVAKLARPALVFNRPCLDSTSMTMAVEDKARQPPRISATGGLLPARAAMLPITAVEIAICEPPSPKIRRRIDFRRSYDSSMPIRNSRNTMPRSPKPETFLASTTVNQ